ncbi:phospholipid-transporting ATPase IF-like [Babylonia areolata]|uniref:phospholipid-transporting ATPase IF-like n=1 Tax=Babylonia areolata TaxID=304850 RepID=UPI003FD3E295
MTRQRSSPDMDSKVLDDSQQQAQSDCLGLKERLREHPLFSRCMKHERSEIRRVRVGHRTSPTLEEEAWVPEKFINNRIVTSKYTLLNFLPKNLFEQFRRVANFYFLVVGIVQLLIDTPITPVTSILPLVFVISVTAVKQGYEDWLRHKADRRVNHRKSTVLEGGRPKLCRSMDIKVGDIVCVRVNDEFPCDMVLLSSSDPQGKCYITTANLDGETNLKTQTCVPETRKYQKDGELEELQALIECEQPVPDLYTFNGRLYLVHQGERILRSLSIENVLLRGARLRNTSYVYGCAIYTGQESKMALNSKHKKNKVSQIERRMNTFLFLFLFLLFLLSSTFTALEHWHIHHIELPWCILEETHDLSVKTLIEDFLSFMVLFNYVIPVSLYVTVEMQKFLGSLFFHWDAEMFDDSINSQALANTSDLNEELGQVEYLFTDKTGTLTDNNMCFRMCSIGGTLYEDIHGQLCSLATHDHRPFPVSGMTGLMEEFFTVLVLCHTVRVDNLSNAEPGDGTSSVFSSCGEDYDYQASSPDEKALVEACRRFGIIYHGTYDQYMEVSFFRQMRKFLILHVLEFSPTRRCMSVIVQNEQGEVYLLCKGAEVSVFDKISAADSDAIQTARAQVDQLAVLGLRTLAIAHRKLTPEQYEQVNALLMEAKTSLQDREQKVEEAYTQVERDLTLLGVTGVEDKLGEQVPETIVALRHAGIKVWVLTGDKQETAVNISYSTGHFHKGMSELYVTAMTSSQQCQEKMTSLQRRTTLSEGEAEHVLVIDGQSLGFALATKECRALLLGLCYSCVAVLCCRMSPLQKAEVVRLVKHSKQHPVTAAIGDGANDVSMIQEAHIGLGIMGKEGRQAVQSSDYAFGKFRFLSRALLLHGHFYYHRLSILVQYFFYKNVAFIMPQIFYQVFTVFSQQTLYDPFCLLFYNITFTSLPILVYSLSEQHLSRSKLLDKPAQYMRITSNANLSWGRFLLWSALGIWHGTVCFFGVFLLFSGQQSLQSDGKMYGLSALGGIVNTAVVFVVNFKLALLIRYWCWPIVAAFLFSAVGNLALSFIGSCFIFPDWATDTNNYYWVQVQFMSSLTVWLSLLLLIFISLIPDILLRTVQDIHNHRTVYRPASSGAQPSTLVGPSRSRSRSAENSRGIALSSERRL